MSTNEAKLSLVQMKMVSEPSANLKKAVAMIAEAAAEGAEIVCLPELFSTPYFPQYDLDPGASKYKIPHDTVPGEISRVLSKAAADNQVILVGGSIFEEAEGHFFNTSLLFDQQGQTIGVYRKTHIPHDEKFFEQSYFEPGDTGFSVVATAKGKIGTLICYDQWFPEAARCNALLGADMVFYPTAIGTAQGIEQAEGDWQSAWENVMRGHAIANGMVVAACNRVGVEDTMTFWGGSFVIDAFGKTLVRGSAAEEIVSATINLEHGRDIKEGWRFFYNRRPQCYDLISKE
ncbi:nitrilase-related carbon-nitrogen hydrolase [Candidatus Methanomassiliicoccus intestinalis]|uniref:nitrilase-related carbon-nitrogen hydrolase n=1 Tax=Candidatus Methanomassiliicoccus intestinalis TaxID=1406512 RepID=UPI0037DC1CF8